MKDMLLLLFSAFRCFCLFVCLFFWGNEPGTVADVDKIMWIIIT